MIVRLQRGVRRRSVLIETSLSLVRFRERECDANDCYHTDAHDCDSDGSPPWVWLPRNQRQPWHGTHDARAEDDEAVRKCLAVRRQRPGAEEPDDDCDESPVHHSCIRLLDAQRPGVQQPDPSVRVVSPVVWKFERWRILPGVQPNPAPRRVEPEGMRHGETYQEPEAGWAG